jgi:hypothetical protein
MKNEVRLERILEDGSVQTLGAGNGDSATYVS